MAFKNLFLAATVSAALAACGGGDPKSDPDASGPDIDAAPEIDAAPDAAQVDCDNLKPLPITATTLNNFSGAEDFAFDADGNLVSSLPGGQMSKQPKSGAPVAFGTKLGGANDVDTAGTVYMANGDLIVANVTEHTMVRFTPDGSNAPFGPSIDYPNGVTAGNNGLVYVAAHNIGQVLEIDPDTGDSTPIATGMFNTNGLSFSPDYSRLYIGSFGGGTIHRIESDGAGGWSAPVLHGNIDSGGGFGGGLDGVTVDACGNVYVTEYIHGKIFRLPPEGGAPQLAVDLPSEWIPNLHWGSGIGGWEKDILYVMDRDRGRVFELDFGVIEKPVVFP